MGDVLGARIGSNDPEEITKVRASVPKILAIGVQSTASPKQAPRTGAVHDERGYLEGRDPRTMSRDELTEMGHKPMSPLRALRLSCLDCCAGSAQEVAMCMSLRCPSWPFRMGTNPHRKLPSGEQLQAMQERGRRLARESCASSSANGHGEWVVIDLRSIAASLCSIESDHPFVPTLPSGRAPRAAAVKDAAAKAAAPAQPARSVLDRASTVLG